MKVPNHSRKDSAQVMVDRESINKIIIDWLATKDTKLPQTIQNNMGSNNNKKWGCKAYTDHIKEEVDPQSRRKRTKISQ